MVNDAPTEEPKFSSLLLLTQPTIDANLKRYSLERSVTAIRGMICGRHESPDDPAVGIRYGSQRDLWEVHGPGRPTEGIREPGRISPPPTDCRKRVPAISAGCRGSQA